MSDVNNGDPTLDEGPNFEDFTDSSSSGDSSTGSGNFDPSSIYNVVRDPETQQKLGQAIEVIKPVVDKVGAKNLVAGIGILFVAGSLLLPEKK